MKFLAKFIKESRSNLLEYYTMFLIIVGLPFVAYLYAGVKLAIAIFIVAQIVINVRAMRGGI